MTVISGPQWRQPGHALLCPTASMRWDGISGQIFPIAMSVEKRQDRFCGLAVLVYAGPMAARLAQVTGVSLI